MANCPATKCPPVFDDPRITINGTAFLEVEQDCKPETGILLLTDQKGLLNVEDESLGDFLTEDLPTKEISGTDDVLLHYPICSSLYREMSCYFGESTRSKKITLGLVLEGETLIEAFDRITQCPVCALTVQTSVYKEDGSLFVDNADYLNFTNHIDGKDDWTHHANTAQASTAFTDMFETGSWAAQANHEQTWQVMDVNCSIKYDEDCNPELDDDGNVIQEPFYINAGLTAAGLHAYHSADDPSYNYTTNSNIASSCHTGRFLDETTGTPGDLSTYDDIPLGSLGQGGLQSLTGLTDGIGAPIVGATRHLSAFLRVGGKTRQNIRYLSSIYVDGSNYADVFYKETAINNDVRRTLEDFKDSYGTTLDEYGQRAEALAIQTVLNKWVRKGVISPDIHDWSSFNNILVNGIRGNGEGYVVGATPRDQLDTADINARYASFIQYCFVVNSPQHGSIIDVCKVPPIQQA